MSVVHTFSHSQSRQHELSAHSPFWNQYKKQNDDNQAEVYQRVPPGDALDTSTSHVVVSFDEGVCSKADMHIGDLVYFTNKRMVTGLNQYLQSVSAPFGPFQYISEAAIKLRQLRQRNPNKAAQFRGYLDSFAAAQGLNPDMFEEWQEVMWAKDRRDLVAHPLKLRAENLSYLKGLVAAKDDSVQHCAAAVDALVRMAEREGLR